MTSITIDLTDGEITIKLPGLTAIRIDPARRRPEPPCGGSPYCQCCPKCGAKCIGDCKCPVTVHLGDGGTLTLEGTDGS